MDDDWLGLESPAAGDDWLGLESFDPGLPISDTNVPPRAGRPAQTGDAEPDDWQITRGLKASWDQTQGLGGAVVALAGQALSGKVPGAEEMRDYGADIYASNMKEAEGHAGNVMSMADIHTVEDGADWLLYTTGNVIGQFAPVLATGGLAGLAGRAVAKKAAIELLEAEISRGAPLQAAVAAAQKKLIAGQVAGSTAGAVTTGVGMSTGEIGGALYDETGEWHPGTALTFGTAAGALDALPITRVLDRLGVGKKFREELTNSFAKDVGIQMALESGTEGAQTVLEKAAQKWVNENYEMFSPENRQEIFDSMGAGAVGGGVITAGSHAAEGVLSGNWREQTEQSGDALELDRRRRQFDLDQQAADAAARAKAAGGDDLDAQIASMQVYLNGEQALSGVSLDAQEPPPGPGGPGAPIPFNPYQQSMEPLALGKMASDGFADDNMLPYAAPEAPTRPPLSLASLAAGDVPGNTIEYAPPAIMDDKARAVEQAEDAYQQQKELESYNTLAPIEDLKPLTKKQWLDQDLDKTPVPARQAMEQAELAELEAAWKALDKGMPKGPATNIKGATPDMELQAAIAAIGGLSREEAIQQGIDPASFQDRVGVRLLFTNNGKTFDQAAEALSEVGFFGDEPYSANRLLEMVDKSLGGTPVYSPQAGSGDERSFRQAEMESIEKAIYDLKYQRDEDDLSPPLGATYQSADDDEKALAYTLMEAELEGIDPMTVDMILDDDRPIPDLIDTLRRNIDNARNTRKARTQRANPVDRQGNPGASLSPGDQGQVAGQESSAQAVTSDNAADKAVISADSAPKTAVATQRAGSNVPATERDARDFNNNKHFVKGAIERVVDPARADKIRQAIERGATDGDIIKAAGITALHRNSVKASDEFPGDVKIKGQSLVLTDRRAGGSTELTIAGTDLAGRLREIYAPAAAEFSLAAQDTAADSDMLNVTLPERHMATAERVQKNTAALSRNSLYKALDELGVKADKLSVDGMRQRLALLRAVLDDMGQHKTLREWQKSSSLALVEQDFLRAAVNIIDPNGGATDTPSAMKGRLFSKLGRLTDMVVASQEERASDDAAESEAARQQREDTASLDAALQPSADFFAKHGKEVMPWWNEASEADRGALLDVLGFGSDDRKKSWVKRKWLTQLETNDEQLPVTQDSKPKKRMGLPNDVLIRAGQHLSSFWLDFKADPAAYVASRAMPAEPLPVLDSVTDWERFNAAAERGELFTDQYAAPATVTQGDAPGVPAAPAQLKKGLSGPSKSEYDDGEELSGDGWKLRVGRANTGKVSSKKGEQAKPGQWVAAVQYRDKNGTDSHTGNVFGGSREDAIMAALQRAYAPDRSKKHQRPAEKGLLDGVMGEVNASRDAARTASTAPEQAVNAIDPLLIKEAEAATYSETVQDPDGNTLKVTQKVATTLRQMDKRLEVLDSLLECLV